jgi:tRNA pseudouridine32 synthase / 23S rRNA pseudouridine746 synthase
MSGAQPTEAAASGFCAACQTEHILPVGDSRRHALALMQQIQTRGCIDNGTDPAFSTAPLFGESRGQMFGVLECRTDAGESVILKAFSGQYTGRWLADGWAPPLINPDTFDRLVEPVDRRIKQLDRLIDETKNPELIRKRKELSQQLMKDLYAEYRLTNFRGETRALSAVFQRPGIPTGAGDCCAPKLLNQAAKTRLHPVGLSEFYFGKENRSGTRRHGMFYPACAGKCQPLLGFLLCGKNGWNNGMREQWNRESPSSFQKSTVPVIHAGTEFVVVVKPSGLLAVPGRGAENQDCVTARIKSLYPHCIEQPAVHRLDMDTSGLMVIALTRDAHRKLSRQFHDRQVDKRYIALLDGELTKNEGSIELPFRLDPDNRPRQIYDPVHGKTGTTHWKKIAVENGQTRVEFRPLTGRTHQLRLHAASEHGLGTPIIGDRLYGSGTAPGQLKLHASFLRFVHPRTGKSLTFRSAPPF